ncbi:glycosyltransferase family 4 protein [Corynebacterium choanae]|uniref:D-inositol 3-phosphate glycosyltransferase n=1 Tax=Corynebacterium choanae TaxID=1862358 RepID=A0A3G6J6I1_9CORY|nr:glycosyltransferase family 4 protein [Corynebacterium choanae]AZA12528.1 D-inositol 3-phosphate glycosyltransferase [Corynebacterium choanae]
MNAKARCSNATALLTHGVAEVARDPWQAATNVARRLPPTLRNTLTAALTSISPRVINATRQDPATTPQSTVTQDTVTSHQRSVHQPLTWRDLLALCGLLLSDRTDAILAILATTPPNPLATSIMLAAHRLPRPDVPLTDRQAVRIHEQFGELDHAHRLLQGTPHWLSRYLISQQRQAISATPQQVLNEIQKTRVQQTFHGAPQQATSPRVLMLLNSSLPVTNSGYTIRSQQLLTALQQNPTPPIVTPVTRLNYPAVIGSWEQASTRTYQTITYQRLQHPIQPIGALRRMQREAQELLLQAQATGAQIIHSTTDYQRGLPALAVARALELPFIYEMRGQREQTWLTQFAAPEADRAAASWQYQALRAAETRLAAAADAVIVLSAVQAETLAKRGISDNRIHIIGNSIDEALLTRQPATGAQRRLLGLEEHSYVFGSVSAIVDYEGLDTLLHAAALLKDKLTIPFQVLIVGDGPARASLVATSQRLGIADRCVFPGKVSPDVALDYTSCCDVFCVPRIDSDVTREITPIKSLAALALGIPTLVSDLPALRSIQPAALHNTLGLLPPDAPSAWADSLYTLADPRRRASLATQCREFAAQRTWRNAADQLAAVYENLVQ